jgi:transcriptional regulator with XRE-family HTH domain
MRSRNVGDLLRDWRQRQRLSQLDLAGRAGVSTRHLSFVETGRSRPSPELVLHLAEKLDVPLRDRNVLLLAAGYAPAYSETDLDAPELAAIRGALDQVLAGYEPYPAVVVDRRWDVVAMNGGVPLLIEGVDGKLLEPPVNALRLALHPDGLAPRIANFDEWSAHLLDRLRRQVLLASEPDVSALYDELAAYPRVIEHAEHAEHAGAEGPAPLAVPLRLRRGDDGGELAFVSTVTTFGTALDITLAELTLEAFLPADAATAAALTATADRT